MRESPKDKRERSENIIHILETTYPDAKCALHFRTPFQLLVAVILSAQCTDKQVNKVTPRLFSLLPTAEAFAKTPLAKIETLVRSTGFYKNKAKNIQSAARQIVEKHNGKVPQTMKELVALSGVGRKTANVVLETGFGKVEGIVVDTHVTRITRLLQLVPKSAGTNAVKIESHLMKLLPKKYWGNFAHLLVFHGRKICIARRPKCDQCPIAPLCPSRRL
jgi:endonuclease-3